MLAATAFAQHALDVHSHIITPKFLSALKREPGVICLFPMQSAEDSTQIRILEIYASDTAYQQHLQTEHFQRYKQGTLHMVKSLKLSPMRPLDPATIKLIFRK